MLVKPNYDTSQILEAIQTWWGGSGNGEYHQWAATALTYDIIQTPYFNITFEAPYIELLNTQQLAAVHQAFAMWDELLGISIKPWDGSGDGPQIDIALSSNTNGDGTYARSHTSGTLPDMTRTIDLMSHAEIWLAAGWPSFTDNAELLPQGYGFEAILHEIAHTLGLSHPGPYNASDDPPPEYLTHALFAQDTRQYTIMSYFGAYANDAGGFWTALSDSGLYSATPQPYDIFALQLKYGANLGTRAGDSHYGYNCNLTDWSFFDFAQNTTPIFTIWDGGGHDTLDDSPNLYADRIDLTPGSFSDVDGYRDNIAIAFGCIIEDAISGSGSDSLTGNQANNLLNAAATLDLAGRDGNDTLLGAAGNDTLLGGNGNNSLDGGPDDDSILAGEGDNTVIGGAGNDTIILGGGANLVDPGAGNDSIVAGYFLSPLDAGAGDDTVIGSGADDSILGGNGNDSIDAGEGRNTILGGYGDDTVSTGSGRDSIAGGDGMDQLFAGDGADTLDGGPGNDLLSGGAYNDRFLFAAGDGHDLVLDFTPGADVIDLGNTAIHYFNALLASGFVEGGILRFKLNLDGGDQLGLPGVELAQLTPQDFKFAEAPPAGGEIVLFGGNSYSSYQTTSLHPTAMAALHGGGFVVLSEQGALPDIGAAIYRGDGSLETSFRVNAVADGWQVGPSVATLADGRFVAAWVSAASAEIVPHVHARLPDASIHFRIFNADGSFWNDEAVLPSDARFNAEHYFDNSNNHGLGDPTVAALADGGFAITWNTAPLGGDPFLVGDRIVQLRFDAAGNQLDLEPQRISNPFDSGYPFQDQQATLFSDGSRVVTWSDGANLHWRFFHADGSAELEDYQAFGTAPQVVELSDGHKLMAYATNAIRVQALDGSWAGGLSETLPIADNFLEGIGGGFSIAALDGGKAGVFWFTGTETGDGAANAIRFAVLYPDGTLGQSLLLNALPAVDPLAALPPDMLTTPELQRLSDVWSGALQLHPSALTLSDGRVLVTWEDYGHDLRAVILDANLTSRTVGGTDGADTLLASGYADHIFARGGDDLIQGRAGADSIDGGAGNDTVTYEMSLVGVVASLASGTGSAGHADGDHLLNVEALAGSSYDDSLEGDAGANRLTGDFGNDSLDGGSAGPDTLLGNQGDDALTLHAAGQALGDVGNDSLLAAGADHALLDGGAGNDTLTANAAGAVTIQGGEGVDSISGTLLAGAELHGGAGDDVMSFEQVGGSFIYAEDGKDYIYLHGGGGNMLFGGAGEDFLATSGSDNNTLFGGSGNDAVSALNGSGNAVHGDAGDDAVSADGGDNSLYGGSGHDSLYASGGNDLLSDDDSSFQTGNDSLVGFGGNDTLLSHNGHDTLDGGAGTDRALLDRSNAMMALSLLPLLSPLLGDGTKLVGIEQVAITGGMAGDTLGAAAGDSTLVGAAGADFLAGDAGNDLLLDYRQDLNLAGNFNNDTLVGGAGDDTLATGGGADSLDGGAGQDLLRIDASQFPGPLSFTAGSGVHGLLWDSLLLAQVANVERFDVTLGGSIGSNFDLGALSGDDTLRGAGGGDTLKGGGGNDSLAGNAGNDTLVGSAGNDTLDGGAGDDSLAGGIGADSIIASDGHNTITGGEGADSILGGSGGDRIWGDAGADSITGGSGADTIWGGAGANTLLGGGGDDALGAGNDGDSLDGGAGHDSVGGGTGNDSLLGGDGNDQLTGGAGNDTLSAGGSGAKYFNGGTGDDSIIAGDGHNTITGGEGADSILGGGGGDRIWGDSGADSIIGGSGADTIWGGAGANTLTGGGGNDAIGNGNDGGLTHGGADDDSLGGGSGADTLFGDGGRDTLLGGGGDDSLAGGDGSDNLAGGAGNDTLLAGDGNDTLSGNDGNDSILADSGVDGIWGDGGSDTLLGSTGSATIWGGDGDDLLLGGSGDGLFGGNAGSDTLQAGSGHQTLAGGLGSDAFRFAGLTGGGIEVHDFVHGADIIELSAAGFAGLAPGALGAAQFALNVAVGAVAQLVYISASGELDWAADGSAGALVRLGLVAANPALGASDFLVVA